MKLVFVGTSPNPRGTEQHLVTLALAVARLGHEVHVFTQPGGFAWRALQGHVAVHAGRFRFSFDPRGLWPLWRLVRRVRPDWLVAGMASEYYPTLLLGRRVALFRHLDRQLSRVKAWFVQRYCDRFFAVSEAVKRTLKMRDVHVLYNPIRPMALSAAEEDAARVGPVVVAFAGAFSASKGIFVLRDAMRTVMERRPDVHMLWLGSGKDEETLRGSVGVRHHFGTWKSDGRLVYAGIDLLVVPSIALESASRVAAEAQLLGKKVCGSNVGGIPEMVCPEMRVHLTPGGDSAALASAIETMLDSDFGDAGRRYATRFLDARIAAEFIRALAQ